MLDARQRSRRYFNENGFITDPLAIQSEALMKVHFWSPEERDIFKEKYIAHPKNFGYVASALANKVFSSEIVFLGLASGGELGLTNFKDFILPSFFGRKFLV